VKEEDLKRRLTAIFLLVLSVVLFLYFYRFGAEFNPDKRLLTFWNTGVPYGIISKGNTLFRMQRMYIEQDFIFGILIPLICIYSGTQKMIPDIIATVQRVKQ
jgi:hypothetical protein